MTLPPLPKQYKTKEADFGVELRDWIMKNPRYACSIETKQTTKPSISFNSVEQKQLNFGMAIKSNKGVLIRVQGINGEPDYVYLRNNPAYITIKYPKGFVLIDVETFIQEKERSKRKSLTWDRAKDIAIKVVVKNRGPQAPRSGN